MKPRAALAGLVLAALLAVSAPAPAGASAVAIRTGGPSAPRERKIAIVAGPASLLGSHFRVYRGHRVVLAGRLQSARGTAAPWQHAYRADLSRVRRPGRYTVVAGGRHSRPWRVRRRGSSDLVPVILRFFENNRDGREPALLHRPSHLHDATIAGGRYDGVHFDLTGGWMDAGDTLHFTQTTAYATAALEAAARLDPRHRAQLQAEAAVGVRWLLKAHPAPGLFVTQIGNNRDHQRGFSDPARDDHSRLPGIGHRLAFHWGKGVGGDIGGKVATALAMAAGADEGPQRDQLLGAAREWYEAGRAAHRPTPKLRHAGNFYVLHSWRDSMAAGAATLYRVTREPAYLRQARRYLERANRHRSLGYANMAPFAAADLCGRLGAPPLGSHRSRREPCRLLRAYGQLAISHSRGNAFAPAGQFAWGTTSTDAAGGAIAALSRLSRGRGCAAGARDYLLGRNPWGASFVVGVGPHSPRHPSSWTSVFGPARPRGAVVGGPAPRKVVEDQGFRPHGPLSRFDSRVVYEDSIEDYVTSEPALDYATNSILLLTALGAE